MQKRILVIFGTRPEAIKMAPLVKELQNSQSEIICEVCVTAQHRQMLDQVLAFFEIVPDYDLNLMKPDQNLYQLTQEVLTGIQTILEKKPYDLVLVHGDTTTSFAAALAAYYAKVEVGHVEAGLRTRNKYSPFPEEMNRQLTGRIAGLHFAPTATARQNLLVENTKDEQIFTVGNTVVDALLLAVEKLNNYSDSEIEGLEKMLEHQDDKNIILITGHRRENFGDGFIDICNAIKEIALQNPNTLIIYPVHLNPNVQKPVFDILDGIDNVRLIAPLSYPAFVWLMKKSYLILTDSGGIQEEAPSLGKPVLVMRNNTERPEAVDAGTVILVGTNKQLILGETSRLLNDKDWYNAMSQKHNPYGDGQASRRVKEAIIANLL